MLVVSIRIQVEATPLRAVRGVEIHKDFLNRTVFRKTFNQKYSGILSGDMNPISLRCEHLYSRDELLSVEPGINLPFSILCVSTYGGSSGYNSRPVAPIHVEGGKTEFERSSIVGSATDFALPAPLLNCHWHIHDRFGKSFRLVQHRIPEGEDSCIKVV